VSDARREEILRASKAPAFDSLAGYEWIGFNVSALVRMLGLQKFIKGFFQGNAHLEGYNIPVLQNGLDAPWLAQPSEESPRRFGFYTVTAVDGAAPSRIYPQAVLLDYGASQRNPVRRIERAIRDYLAQPDPADPDVLLGKAYFALGRLRIPSNFLFSRDCGRYRGNLELRFNLDRRGQKSRQRPGIGSQSQPVGGRGLDQPGEQRQVAGNHRLVPLFDGVG